MTELLIIVNFCYRLLLSLVINLHSSSYYVIYFYKIKDIRFNHCMYVDSIVSSSLEYSWVVQQHSIASYPELWTHPVKLLAEFSQTEDYKTCLATASRDTPSHFHDRYYNRLCI